MKIEWKTCFRVCLSVFLLYLCITCWSYVGGLLKLAVSAAMPLIIGCVIAYILNILMSFYERHFFPKTGKSWLVKSRRPVCMLGAMVTLVVIVVLLINLVVPELVACVKLLAAQIPPAVENALAWLEEKGIVPADILASLENVDWQAKLQQMLRVLLNGVGSVMGTAVNVVSSVFSGVVTAVFAVIFCVYLLAGKEKLGSQFDRLMKHYMKPGLYGKSRKLLSVLDDCFHKYIVGQCTEAVILGTLCTLGMLLLRLPYATMTGAVIAFTALIPVAGGYIGAAVGAFMILTVSPIKAVFFLIFILILQQLENNLIYPRVVGSSIGLPAIWVLAAVTVGGGVLGIVGMLIGVPLAAALYRFLREDVNRLPAQTEGAA